MSRFFVVFVVTLLSLAVTPPARADEVVLKNGDRISGTIVNKDNGFLTINTEYAGDIRVDWQFIATIEASKALVVLLKTKEVVRANKITIEPSQNALIINKKDVQLVNPPPYLSGKGTLWSGRLNLGISASEGNTDAETGHASAAVSARTAKRRYKLSGAYNWATDLGQETENNMEGIGKVDHFLSKKWFVSGRTAFYKDRFQDLNLRAMIGGSSGYQFVESHTKNFMVEAGVDYVYEDYSAPEDKEYPAARWALAYDVFVAREKVQFYHEHNLHVSLEESKDIILKSETGLRFYISGNFNSTLQVDFDWNNSPAADKERADSKYIFSLGYSW